MTQLHRLEHRFVRTVPDVLGAGLIYISVEFATAIHLCACGCGQEVVTPLSPHDWSLTFDGETVSLSPSIGNWGFACRSHYLIKRGEVVWVPKDDDDIPWWHNWQWWRRQEHGNGSNANSSGCARPGEKGRKR